MEKLGEEKIDLNTLKNWKILKEQLKPIEESIEYRCNYVVKEIVKIFHKKFDWWDFDNSCEDERGHFDPDYIQYEVVGTSIAGCINMIAILKEEGEWDLAQGFPLRFLFEDFQQEVIDGRELYKKKEEEENKKAQELKKLKAFENEKIKEAARAKLTKEERKALGIL